MRHYIRNVPALKGGPTISSDGEDEESDLNMIKAAQKMRTTFDESRIHPDLRTQEAPTPHAAAPLPAPHVPASQAPAPQVPTPQAPAPQVPALWQAPAFQTITPQVPAPQAPAPQVPAPHIPTPAPQAPAPQAPVSQVISNKRQSCATTPFDGELTPQSSPASKRAKPSKDKTSSDKNAAKKSGKPNQVLRRSTRKNY